jgi:hypothetical protein
MVAPDAQFIEVWARDGESFTRVGDFGEDESFPSATLSVPVTLAGVWG